MNKNKTDELDEALAAFMDRGHVYTSYKKVVAGNGRIYYDIECVKCTCEMRLSPEPAPNECFASGTALALNCRDGFPEKDVSDDVMPLEYGYDFVTTIRDLFNLN